MRRRSNLNNTIDREIEDIASLYSPMSPVLMLCICDKKPTSEAVTRGSEPGDPSFFQSSYHLVYFGAGNFGRVLLDPGSNVKCGLEDMMS